jgi:hypothetical protein
MAGWLLILTIAASDHRGGSAITQIGPFESKEACLAAGTGWLHQQEQNNFYGAAPHIQSLCVRQF